jgi:hypothetical protein
MRAIMNRLCRLENAAAPVKREQAMIEIAKMLSKVADLLQVTSDGIRCEVAHRHVVNHPLAQWGNLAGGSNGICQPMLCCSW